MKTMYGIIAAMTTPFLENGEVDIKALEQETEFLIQSGVDCLYPCGTTGEMLFMTCEQRECVAETVIRKAAGRVVVFIHTGAQRLEDTLRLSCHAGRAGADAIGVVTPSFFGLTQGELEEFYKTVSKAVPQDFPMYLYNIPQCSGNDIQTETCRRIAEACPNVVGIKYSFADVHRALEYLQIRDGDFSVLVGFDRLLLPALAMGCGGTVSGAATVFPEPLVEGLKAYREGNIEQARRWMKEADGIIRALQAGTRMSIFKAAQQMRGLIGGHVHKPLSDLSEVEREELACALAPYLKRYPMPQI